SMTWIEPRPLLPACPTAGDLTDCRAHAWAPPPAYRRVTLSIRMLPQWLNSSAWACVRMPALSKAWTWLRNACTLPDLEAHPPPPLIWGGVPTPQAAFDGKLALRPSAGRARDRATRPGRRAERWNAAQARRFAAPAGPAAGSARFIRPR